MLITDHNVRETLGLIDRAYIIHSGRVLTEGAPDEIVANPTCASSIWARISGSEPASSGGENPPGRLDKVDML